MYKIDKRVFIITESKTRNLAVSSQTASVERATAAETRKAQISLITGFWGKIIAAWITFVWFGLVLVELQWFVLSLESFGAKLIEEMGYKCLFRLKQQNSHNNLDTVTHLISIILQLISLAYPLNYKCQNTSK